MLQDEKLELHTSMASRLSWTLLYFNDNILVLL